MKKKYCLTCKANYYGGSCQFSGWLKYSKIHCFCVFFFLFFFLQSCCKFLTTSSKLQRLGDNANKPSELGYTAQLNLYWANSSLLNGLHEREAGLPTYTVLVELQLVFVPLLPLLIILLLNISTGEIPAELPEPVLWSGKGVEHQGSSSGLKCCQQRWQKIVVGREPWKISSLVTSSKQGGLWC